jgi:hypothetical protein
MPLATDRERPIRVDWIWTMHGSPTLQMRSVHSSVMPRARSMSQSAGASSAVCIRAVHPDARVERRTGTATGLWEGFDIRRLLWAWTSYMGLDQDETGLV